MITETYTPPVSQLLSYGDDEVARTAEWPDYLALGFGVETLHPKKRKTNARWQS